MNGLGTLGRVTISMAAVVALASCGSSGGSGGDSEPAEAKVDEAKSVVAKYQAPLETFNLPPMKSTPPRGKRIALVVNNLTNTKHILDGAQEAAKVLGWTTIPIVFDPSKATGLQDAFTHAVSENPDGVVTLAADTTEYADAAKKLAEKNIPVVTSSTIDAVEPPLIANVLDAKQVALSGRITANYVIATEGADANVAMFNVPFFSILAVYEKAFKEEYLRLCPNCEYKSVAVQSSAIGTTVPAQVVSAVQTDPSINFAVMGFGAVSTGVSGALRTAGISGVKIIGEAASLANIQAVIDGTEDMWVGFPQYGMGWKSIDALARYFNDESVEISTTADMPFQILTEKNTPRPAAAPEVTDYQDYFKDLWHLN